MIERRGRHGNQANNAGSGFYLREYPVFSDDGLPLACLSVFADVLFRLFYQAAIADEDRAALVQVGGLDIQDVSMTI